VRFRGKEVGCKGCLRVTVGTEKEVDKLLQEIEQVIGDVSGGQVGVNGKGEEESREIEANEVIA